jgi:uncharacterized protein YbgA (DUF1722 family)
MLKWAGEKLKALEHEKLCGFIFKSRSPSSAIRGVKIHAEAGIPMRTGAGIFGGAFQKHFPRLPVEDEGRLLDPALRENFIERVFVFRRWRDFLQQGSSLKNLVSFHTKHTLLIMTHSPQHYSALGRLVAGGERKYLKKFIEEYITILMEGLRLLATVKKNTKVLMHGMGYFKKQISADEKQELLEVIENYQNGLIPLIVPVTLLNHYVRKFEEPYLRQQVYLKPHPVELMLRNHV